MCVLGRVIQKKSMLNDADSIGHVILPRSQQPQF